MLHDYLDTQRNLLLANLLDHPREPIYRTIERSIRFTSRFRSFLAMRRCSFLFLSSSTRLLGIIQIHTTRTVKNRYLPLEDTAITETDSRKLDPNRILQRITHMKAKKRLPQDDHETYPNTIRGYSNRHIWHCGDELLRLDYMILHDCLQRLTAISHDRVAFEKDINEQVIFIGAETQTLLDSMISKLNVIRKCWVCYCSSSAL